MRIISGKYKGKKILFPSKLITRPLRDRVKESIFNILQHSNKIQFEIPLNLPNQNLQLDSSALKFNADYLKAIFDANYGAVGNAYVSNDGAMKLDFESEDGQKSSYIILAKV